MDSKDIKILDAFVFVHDSSKERVVTIITNGPLHKSQKIEFCKPFKTGFVLLNGKETQYGLKEDPLAIMVRGGMLRMLYERDCVYMTSLSMVDDRPQ